MDKNTKVLSNTIFSCVILLYQIPWNTKYRSKLVIPHTGSKRVIPPNTTLYRCDLSVRYLNKANSSIFTHINKLHRMTVHGKDIGIKLAVKTLGNSKKSDGTYIQDKGTFKRQSP